MQKHDKEYMYMGIINFDTIKWNWMIIDLGQTVK